MNRMLYLRDLDVDVLIRCRACGHEGVLPHAEALRRFGASYPVLSIAPHYRCSACNARDAESLAAPAPEPLYATPVDDYAAHDDDDGGFAAALASLQNLVEAAHASPAAASRKAAPRPEPEPEPVFAPPPPPINAAWDEDEEAAARAAWDAAPVWTPPPAVLQDDEEDFPSPRRKRDTPALPDKPFFSSRERSRRPPETEPPPPSFAFANANDEDDDDFVREEPKRDPSDVPLSAMPILSLADIKALLGEEEDAAPPGEEPPPFSPADADVEHIVADGETDADDDEDDPLLSSALQRLLRNASVETEDDDEAAAETRDQAEFAAAELFKAPEPDEDGTPFGDFAAEPDATDGELSDEELISFAIGDRDAAVSSPTPSSGAIDALPPEMAALLADDADEDEVYEYAPDEILDAAAEPPPLGADDDFTVEDEPALSASAAADLSDLDIAEIVDFAAPPDIESDDAEIAEIEPAETNFADDEPLLLEDEAPVPVVAPEQDEDDDPDLAALRALLAETEERDHADELDIDDLALDGLAADRSDAKEPDGAASTRGGYERPPRDSLLRDNDDETAPPPAWRTQRPPPGPDEEGGEAMEDALATLRALIEQAAAEPDDDDAPAAESAAVPAPARADEVDDLEEEATPPPSAFTSRIDDDEDDPEAWAALMREVAAKAAGDDGDDTLPLAPAPPAPAFAPTPVPGPVPAEQRDPEEKAAAKRGGSLDDTLTRLRGLLDLPQEEPSRGRGRRR